MRQTEWPQIRRQTRNSPIDQLTVPECQSAGCVTTYAIPAEQLRQSTGMCDVPNGLHTPAGLFIASQLGPGSLQASMPKNHLPGGYP